MPERLLYAISSSGKMSFSNYDNSFSTIFYMVHKAFPENVSYTYLKYRTLRLLDALCHCDYDFGKRYVYVCPPTLVPLPTFGLPKFLLTGARDQDLIRGIRRFTAENKNQVSMVIIPQNVQHALLPPAIYLETINKELVINAASKLHININTDNNAAWSLINFSINISDIDQAVSFDAHDEPNWPKRSFLSSELVFSKYQAEDEEFKLVEYTNSRDQQKLYFLWHGTNAAEVDRDWGSFLLFYKQKKNIILYDPKKFLLAIPQIIPLPRLIARSLTLCTGLAPFNGTIKGKPAKTLPLNCRFNIYQSVIPPIAQVVSIKLGQSLLNYEIDLKEVSKSYD